MTKDEMLQMLGELKEISSRNENLLWNLQKIEGERVKLISEIESLSARQSELMNKFINLCENKELLDKFRNLSEEKENLFKSFTDARKEEDLLELEGKIVANTDKWVENFQNIVTGVLQKAKSE
ncbi:MAG: hypothetical protein ABRQ39_24675 [Candidatus Eremiobacterota bacterium]